MRKFLITFVFILSYLNINSQTFDYSKNRENNNQINLKLNTGLNFIKFDINNNEIQNSSIDFGPQIALHIGAELEYILPSNNNKWAIFVEPNYISYRSEKERELFSSTEKVITEANSLNLPIGLRHYMYLNDEIRLFINGILNVQVESNTTITYSQRRDLKSEANPSNFAIGIGGVLNNKFFVEARVFSKFNALKEYAYWKGNFSQFSFIVGYNIL